MRFKLKLPAVNNKMILNSVFNVGRSLINPLFVALVSYLFISRRLPHELEDINKITAIVNLLLVFSGWGLKDFLLKDSAKHFSEFKKNWHLAFYSKFVLLLPLLLIAALCFPKDYLVFIALLVLIRTFGTLYEPIIVLHKKSQLFFTVELLVAFLLIALVAFSVVKNFTHFFYFLLAAEFLKLIFNILVFKQPSRFFFNYPELLFFLKSTRFYFFLVLVSFFQSRVDLYLLGFLFSPEKLNEYQLLLSLISLSQIAIASFAIPYAKLFYRNIHSSMLSFRRIIFTVGGTVAILSAFLIYIILNFMYHFDFSFIGMLIVVFNICVFSWVLSEMYAYTKLEWLGRMLRFVFISGLSNFLFSMILIPQLGVTGALSANSLSMLVLAALMNRQRLILLK